MRVLLDTNVLVRATAKSHGPARAVLLQLLGAPHVLVVSEFLLNELRRVLKYPRVERVHGMADAEIEQYVQDLTTWAEMVDVPPSFSRQVVHDPDDDPIVACAVYGRADVLCTLDRHLRRPEVVEYLLNFNIRVLSDAELAAVLRTPDLPALQ